MFYWMKRELRVDAKLWIFTGQATSPPSPVMMSSDQNNEITDMNGRNGLSLRDRVRPVLAHLGAPCWLHGRAGGSGCPCLNCYPHLSSEDGCIDGS